LIALMAITVAGCLPVCYAGGGAAALSKDVKSPDHAVGASTQPQR